MAGASGMIGSTLRTRLIAAGHQVRTLVRQGGDGENRETWCWAGTVGSVPPESIEWADAVLSFNGAPLTRLPWTQRYRRSIFDSRVDTTSALAQAIVETKQPPMVWISASAVGFYGDTHEREVDESTPYGSGFLVDVTKAWETATQPAWDVTRVIQARTGLVLGPEGALKSLLMTTRFGLGARIGSGQQWWPWISLEDEVRAWEFLLTADSEGPVNLVGPTPQRSGEITKALANLMHRPCALIVPRPVLRLVMGLAADELLLASQKIHSTVLERAGFTFHHQVASHALAAVLEQE